MPRAVADALANVSGLPVLCLSLRHEREMWDEEEEEGREAELGPGPLWEGLKELRWDCPQRLPQVRRERLRLLQTASSCCHCMFPEEHVPSTLAVMLFLPAGSATPAFS